MSDDTAYCVNSDGNEATHSLWVGMTSNGTPVTELVCGGCAFPEFEE